MSLWNVYSILTRCSAFLRQAVLVSTLGVLLAGCASSASNSDTTGSEPVEFGVLVMAHGGGEEWDAAVESSLAQLEARYPVAAAFGMADAGSMERAVRELEAAGVDHVGVVRMFISGESWYERTEQILGLNDGAPSKAEAMAKMASEPERRMPMGFWQIDTDLEFHLSEEGLADAEEMDQVLLTRIRNLSQNPAEETVMVLAHGPGDDAENARWIARISERAELARKQLGVADISVFTLREDWEDKREQAEQQIRSYVQQASASGKTTLVVPYRVMGFGPYHGVLSGLDYRADETGLVPHDNVGLWLMNQAGDLQQRANRKQRRVMASSQ
jgi:sirohydrochlorin ferrochelatase